MTSFVHLQAPPRRSGRHQLAAVCFGLLLAAGNAAAAPTIVSVSGKSGPWAFSDTLNSSYSYGDPDNQDFAPPTTVSLSSLGLAPGAGFGALFVDGLTSAFVDVLPNVDNAGYAYLFPAFKDDALGSSEYHLPSFYLPDQWGVAQALADPTVNAALSGLALNALLFAILDSDGQIIQLQSLGTYTTYIDPPDGPGGSMRLVGVSFSLPANAAYVSFGVNDDMFADNSGALRVCIGSSSDVGFDSCARAAEGGGEVPEPASVALVGLGLLGLGAARRRAG